MYWKMAVSACRRVFHNLRQISSALRCPAGYCAAMAERDGLEEGFNGGIVIAVAFAAHPLPGSGCLHPREGTP
jgi:hypothetical protein